MDILRFSCSIPQHFHLSELFDLETTPKDETYMLKSVVCFLGAHYMTYIKQRNQTEHGIIPFWKLYDDNRQIATFQSWQEILEKMLEFGTLPTVLVYEKKNSVNQHDDLYDKMQSTDLISLDKKAR